MDAHLAALALGSNLAGTQASREANLQAAVRLLSSLGEVVAVSSWMDTAPVTFTEQPRFLNGAALLRTALEPLALLDRLLHIEQQLGRDRSHGIAKGPRTLDLDLLLYDDVVYGSERLTLPHPEMHRRLFVLQPLVEIAPEMVHPALGYTVRELLDDLT